MSDIFTGLGKLGSFLAGIGILSQELSKPSGKSRGSGALGGGGYGLLRSTSPRRKVPELGLGISPSDVHQIRMNLLGELPRGDSGVTRQGVYSVDQRVHVIANLIQRFGRDPRWQRIVAPVIAQRCYEPQGADGGWCIKENDYLEECRALFDAVKRKVRYTRDPPGVDTYSHPARLAEIEMGDCDDYVIIYGSSVRVIGVSDIILRIIQEVGQPDFNHIYLMVRPVHPPNPKPGQVYKNLPPEAQWYSVDLSKPDNIDPGVPPHFGWEPPGASQVARAQYEGKDTSEIPGIVEKVKDFVVPL